MVQGFLWMSNAHATAYYWSHAGQHFEIRDEGDWWALRHLLVSPWQSSQIPALDCPADLL